MAIQLTFAQPIWFLLLLLLIPMLWHYRRNQPKFVFSSAIPFLKLKKPRPLWVTAHYTPLILRSLVVFFIVTGLARPQILSGTSKSRSEGLDILLVIDTSGSMKAMDYVVNGKRTDRITIVKQVIGQFISQRPDDRIGMVVFASQAFAQAPLTLDHDVLAQYLDQVNVGMAGDATAIGDALAIGVNRLKEIQSKSKMMILLTDGGNNAGKIDPRDAAKAAQSFGVKIYTIGAGSEGTAPIPTPYGVQQIQADLDEGLLQDIASTTGGKFFRAKDTEALVQVYQTIDKLEKTQSEVTVYHNYDEKFPFFVMLAMLCLFLEGIFSLTPWRRIP